MCDVVTGLGHGRYSMELSLHDAAWTSDGYQFVILNPRTEPLYSTPDEAPAHSDTFPTITGLHLDLSLIHI